MRLVIAGIVSIAIGSSIFASVAVPAHLSLSEFVPLILCIAFAWQHLLIDDAESKNAWVEDTPASERRDFRPWDVEQAVLRLRPVAVSHPRISTRQSMEQIMQDVLTRTFRRAR